MGKRLTSDQTVVRSPDRLLIGKFDPLESTAGGPAGGAYIWGKILDLPPHIAVVGKATKYFSAILAPLINSLISRSEIIAGLQIDLAVDCGSSG